MTDFLIVGLDGKNLWGKGSVTYGPDSEHPEYVRYDDGKRIIEARRHSDALGKPRLMYWQRDGRTIFEAPVVIDRRRPRFRRPRWLHRAFAHAMGFFWAPCPVCGRMRGGHEKPGGTMMETLIDPSRGFVTCWGCPGYYWPDGTPMDEREYDATVRAAMHARRERLPAWDGGPAS